ncbi:histidine phosphatase family protein [Leisingera daeponensis]|uniref:histidine phosphatase family protein n=1 Tax=Leisingera daeponensis TaxID=405746 RepID=UPI001C98BDD0|nr:histidine phosphatase family protein [Leisingera daeponensis]MBY6054960.1 histidine phosphatase family protein [Leisingera daeponensis]
MQFPKIWLLRHGQTEWNAERRIQGQLESPLTPQGVEQARRQATLMAPVMAQKPACYASPLGRAQQTADIALGGAPFVTDPRLAEAYAGAFQGMSLAEVAAEYPQIHRANPRNLDLFCEAPGGEGYGRFHARILDFMQSLAGPSVVVAHGLLGQVMRGIVCGLTRDRMAALPNGQGCVYVLENGAETVLE